MTDRMDRTARASSIYIDAGNRKSQEMNLPGRMKWLGVRRDNGRAVLIVSYLFEVGSGSSPRKICVICGAPDEKNERFMFGKETLIGQVDDLFVFDITNAEPHARWSDFVDAFTDKDREKMVSFCEHKGVRDYILIGLSIDGVGRKCLLTDEGPIEFADHKFWITDAQAARP